MQGRKTSKPFKGFGNKPTTRSPRIKQGDRVTFPGGRGHVLEVYKASAWVQLQQSRLSKKRVKTLLPLWLLKRVDAEEYHNG